MEKPALKAIKNVSIKTRFIENLALGGNYEI